MHVIVIDSSVDSEIEFDDIQDQKDQQNDDGKWITPFKSIFYEHETYSKSWNKNSRTQLKIPLKSPSLY